MSVTRELASLLGSQVTTLTDGTFWMPVQGSSTAPMVDQLFQFILWLSVFFFVLIVGLMVLFVVRYRRRVGREEPEPSPDHNMPLEVTWTVIPIALVIVLFAWGFKVFMDINTPPANAYEIQVTGQKWKWLFTYPDGHVDEDLHVPVDTPVRLVMTSEDVIHGFYIPAFRLKHDVVPGRYAKLWFRATTPGEYQLFCTQYCGTGHSNMLAKVVVHEPGGFEKWLQNASNFLKTMSPAQAGERLYRTRGCAQCHSVTGTAGIGPSFKGVFGHEVALSTGTSVLADENYVRESILDPQAKVVAGFQPVMPTFKGRLKDDEITAIIAYLKTLQ
ncbi:MAG: cytochrome c oxidase subunit II [Acidobacteriota bacterium]